MVVDVLIIGGGFGGAFAAQHLDRKLKGTRSVLLVAPTNFMLFSPLLPEAASGTLEPRHAVIPLRELLATVDVEVGTVKSLDAQHKTAVIENLNGELQDVRFEVALIAVGSTPTVLPIPGLIDHAVGFKTLADAIWLRNRVLHQLDAAASSDDPARRRELLTFTFVGGGYAGVEAAAELESLARDAARRYPNLRQADFRWVLVEAADSLLPGLDARLARFSARHLERRGVEVFLNTRMVDCRQGIVRIDPERVPPYRSPTIVWTAGQRPHPEAANWGLPVDEDGYVPVDDHMRVAGLSGIYAVGDVAAAPDPEGGSAPNTAQHALRQARVAAANITADLTGHQPEVYDYRSLGLAVTLGKWQGTAQVARFTFTGPVAWWMGRSYHLLMMPGLGRKARVVTDWTMSLFFKRDIAQLGQLGRPTPLE
jgi:NADH dehydrogenase